MLLINFLRSLTVKINLKKFKKAEIFTIVATAMSDSEITVCIKWQQMSPQLWTVTSIVH